LARPTRQELLDAKVGAVAASCPVDPKAFPPAIQSTATPLFGTPNEDEANPALDFLNAI